MMSLDEKVEVLKKLVEEESITLVARMTVDRHIRSRDLAIALAVERLVPRILHMKLRVTEKILHSLINTGLEQYNNSVIDGERRKMFESHVTACMRSSVFGNEAIGRKFQLKFSWKQGNHAIEKPNLSGPACNKVMAGCKSLIRCIFNEALDKEPGKDGNTLKVQRRIVNLLQK
jgi:hypothetical protein